MPRTDRTIRKHLPQHAPDDAPRSPKGVLQQLADESPATRHLVGLGRQSRVVFQRNEGEKDAEQAPIPVILSMDGDMIGSVYFEGGRIRTTHVAGPEDERGRHDVIKRYNVDLRIAQNMHRFETTTGQNGGRDDLYDWMSMRLRETENHRWVIAVIPSAKDMAPGDAPAGTVLFETFASSTGEDEGYHPSRGAATRETMPPGDIAALEAAIASVRDGQTSRKNRDFFMSLLASAPKLAARMRLPEEIDAQDAEWSREDAEDGVAEIDRILGEDRSTLSDAENTQNLFEALRAHKAVVDAVANTRSAAANARDTSYRTDAPSTAALEMRAAKAAMRAMKSELDAAEQRAIAKIKLNKILEADRTA